MADQQALALDVPRVAKRSTSRVVRRPADPPVLDIPPPDRRSHSADMQAAPGSRAYDRHEMLEAYKRFGPMTARDACDYYGNDGGWRRVSELVQGGHLEPTGETAPGKLGRPARVLKITDRGRAALEASS